MEINITLIPAGCAPARRFKPGGQNFLCNERKEKKNPSLNDSMLFFAELISTDHFLKSNRLSVAFMVIKFFTILTFKANMEIHKSGLGTCSSPMMFPAF